MLPPSGRRRENMVRLSYLIRDEIERWTNSQLVYTKNNWWRWFLYCGRISAGNSAETDRIERAYGQRLRARGHVRVCFYLAALPTFPLLSASVNPVVSQHVLLTETETFQTFSRVAKTGSGKKTWHTRGLTSLRQRDPPSLKVGLHRKLICRHKK